MTIRYAFILTVLLVCAASGQVFSQLINGQNTITTAVPFLGISPDARGASMGDAGVATSPDANSLYWNPAKTVFSEKKFGVGLSFTPWLKKLVSDMNISYLSAYYKVDDKQALGFSLLYFNLGDIEFTSNTADPIGSFSPREVALAASYSRKLSENFSTAVNLKYINSNLVGNYGDIVHGGTSKPGSTAALDVGVYYTKDINAGGKDLNLSFGGMISNLGGKISYNSVQKDFIPTNLKVGTALTYNVDAYSKFTLALDFNKLMVPTPDTVGTGNGTNKNASKGLVSGVFGSFSDAPGGFKEEMREVAISTGLEYWYNDVFALRAGYFAENRYKGDRKYITVGMGIRYQKIGLDFAYLLPQKQNSPLAETLRFSLHLNFDGSGSGSDAGTSN